MSDRLYCDPHLAQFYDLDNGWHPGLDYFLKSAGRANSILDLGCGTGLFLSRIPKPHLATGVDPAGAMLEIARQQQNGGKVNWIEADARTLRIDARFELIVLTGHAFQVFLTHEDQRAVLKTIATHLAPGGTFVFDTRNPGAQEWRSWTPDQTRHGIEHPRLGPITTWNDVEYDEKTAVVTYETHYQVASNDRHFSAESKIKFAPQDQLAGLIDSAGLTVETWHGDWHGNEFSAASPEIILMGHLD